MFVQYMNMFGHYMTFLFCHHHPNINYSCISIDIVRYQFEAIPIKLKHCHFTRAILQELKGSIRPHRINYYNLEIIIFNEDGQI